MKVIRVATAGLAVLVLAFGLGALAQTSVEEHKVEITKSGFSPAALEIKAGEKVTWTNMDEKEHSVTSNEKGPGLPEVRPLFDSGSIKPGATWEYTFQKVGSYGYHCSKDAAMTGTVTVK